MRYSSCGYRCRYCDSKWRTIRKKQEEHLLVWNEKYNEAKQKARDAKISNNKNTKKKWTYIIKEQQDSDHAIILCLGANQTATSCYTRARCYTLHHGMAMHHDWYGGPFCNPVWILTTDNYRTSWPGYRLDPHMGNTTLNTNYDTNKYTSSLWSPWHMHGHWYGHFVSLPIWMLSPPTQRQLTSKNVKARTK